MSTAKNRRRPNWRRPLIGVCLALAAVAPLCLAPTSANADQTQESIFQDDTMLTLNPGDQAAQLAEIKALGPRTIHFLITWQDLAPNPAAKHKPSGFSDTSPNDYDAGKWSKYDQFITAAKNAGFDLIVTPNGPAPKWAQKCRPKKSGLASCRPDAKLFGNFVHAIGTRYSGSNGQPRLDRWSFWNEPNLPGWLQPQTVNGVPVAPHLYRKLFQAGYSALSQSGHGGDQIMAGELAPIGSSDLHSALSPGVFLREFFCLDANYKPFRGGAAKTRGCNGFKKIKANAFSHHPYMKSAAALTVPKNRNWFPIAASNRLSALLNKAAARGRIKRGIPIYFTEFGVQSNPPDKLAGVSLSSQAAYMNDAEYLSYKFGRARSWPQYEMRDDPLFTQFGSSDPRRYGGFQTGLRFFDGREKPAYDAYRLPIHVKRLSSGKVRLWGMVRPIEDGPHTVQIKVGGSDVGAPTEVTNSRGYFQQEISRAGAGKARWSFTWQDNDGHNFSSRSNKPTRK